MNEAVICEPLRTPVGRYGGAFRSLRAADLAAQVIRALMDRTGLPPALVDDVIFGQCYPSGEAPAIGRVAALDAGLPVGVPGLQVDRRCGSGLQAVLDAAMRVQTGVCDVVIAGGTESMSNVEFYSDSMRWGTRGSVELHDRLVRARVTAGGAGYPVEHGMLETAENLRREYGITREEQDQLALTSHRRALAAIEDGRFDAEIVPVTVPAQGKRPAAVVTCDEHPRADASLEKFASLTPVLRGADPQSTVTAGNASGQNDAAAACIVTTPAIAAEHGLRPLGKVLSWAVSGVAPQTMGIGPVPSTGRALSRAGLTLADIDLIELNEAFAAQVLACTREWDFAPADFDRLNVNGSGISLGHPVGATGVRILTTLLHEMRRRNARYGLETMCIGGGQGLTAVLEAAQ
ncbi:acetyl-CoA C-acetyltransferase [Streptomyces shenzhenensis]|uniref:acetyl-CoA C-acetyltransferase n=1 Tax=Streptomyces shenzhenensis TaxID=943815 RepID=UPI0033FD8D02